ncbi:MAG: transcription-repair coupling factor [Caldisericia bacterium]|nr:transcription-repair coupling factor [Caldisericia bacterium]MDD4614853.1 transcription-repair coupling factor [Caldisericia bacterium]
MKTENQISEKTFKEIADYFSHLPSLEKTHLHSSHPFSVHVNNVVGSSGYLVILQLLQTFSNLLIVASSDLEMQKIHTFLKQFPSSYLPSEVSRYPDTGAAPYERIPSPSEISAEQISVLFDLIHHPRIVVTTPQALCAPTISPENLIDAVIPIHRGDCVDLEDLSRKLLSIGYRPASVVEHVGEFRRKGGIFDVFSSAHNSPIRIELLDDQVESIRFFDSTSQLSIEKTDLVFLIPISHYVCTKEEKEKAQTYIKNVIQTKNVFSPDIEKDLEVLSQEEGILLHSYYFPVSRSTECTLIDHLHEHTCIVFLNANQIHKAITVTFHEAIEVHTLELEKKEVISIPFNDVYRDIERKIWNHPYRLELNPEPANVEKPDSFSFPTQEVNAPILGDFKMILKQYFQRDGKVFVATRQPKRAIEIFESFGFTCLSHNLQIEDMYMDTGFYVPSKKLALLTDREIFGWKQPHKHYKKFREGTPIKSIEDLKIGDLLVHYSYGIGVYKGLSVLDGPEKKPKEFLLMEYKNGDELYIPPERIHMVNKYVGDSQHMPLSSLGTTEWQKTKQKAKKGIELVAAELVDLYAKKAAAKGHAFGKDSPWQTEMESIFPYEETPDQMRTIEEVKQDMESSTIMDRIVTGDVGYGKTEIAIRAAFKAVLDGHQVALLVPTTILANQHYETFKERYAPFPIRIAQASRLISSKRLHQNLEDLQNGKIDLIIGTHRLLSKDVYFQNLGLLIIDEEHKFGVRHKERIRTMRENVDVLTLTATPIPRTLSMALSGVRSISKIDTSPEGRKPVKTYVMPDDPEVLLNAIQFELSRGGQVYYVHNRIQGIMDLKEDLQKKMPSLRIGVGHGKMTGEQIDNVITQFLQGELDLLLCTTIIESGIDIPTVNTLIVDHSDALGLAQMYQLRGRVGRSSKRAYAYFFYPKQKALTQKSISRLQAMQNFIELGSGLKIAMRDLEIRGAGTFLGTSQSGHLHSVGYHMYVQLLKEAVEHQREPSKKKEPNQMPEFPITGYIPNDLIRDEGERLSMYRELTQAKTKEDIDLLVKEYQDQFGNPPSPMLELYENLKLRLVCYEKGMKNVKLERNLLFFYFQEHSERFSISANNLSCLCQKFGKRIHFYEGYFTVQKNQDEFNMVIREVMACF